MPCKPDASLFSLLHTFQISLAVQVDEGTVIRNPVCQTVAVLVLAGPFDRKLVLVDHVVMDIIPHFSSQLEKRELTLGLRS